jgi:hypothetical protein
MWRVAFLVDFLAGGGSKPPSSACSFPSLAVLRNEKVAGFSMLPNGSDVRFLGQCGVTELHKLDENRADESFRNRASLQSAGLLAQTHSVPRSSKRLQFLPEIS